jgi:hypothetical protein
MSSSLTIDLVQDAASDCSVVTSLCAAVARAERGHEQVSNFNQAATLYTNKQRCLRTSSTLSINSSASRSRRRTANMSYD